MIQSRATALQLKNGRKAKFVKKKKKDDCNFSSIKNEVITAILNFFIQKLHNYKKAQNAHKRTEIKKCS